MQSCSIGYWICEEKMGQGLMSEAINLIKKFIFDELDLHRLEAACLPVNKRSLRTLKNNGFAIEGLVRKYLKLADLSEVTLSYTFYKNADTPIS